MEHTAPATPYQVLKDLETCYEEFRAALTQAKAANMGETIGFFFRGQGNPRVGEALARFDPRITALVETLAGLLASCPPEQASELAALALEQLLFYPKAGDSTLDFSQMALEGRAQPLLAFLTPERRLSLAARYKKRTPPRMMMPNQKKLWEALSH